MADQEVRRLRRVRAAYFGAVLLVTMAVLVVCTGRQTVDIDALIVSADGRTLSFNTGTCDQREAATVDETPTTVTVRATADRVFSGGADCDAIVHVKLQQPLGRRIVVDAATGESVVAESTERPIP